MRWAVMELIDGLWMSERIEVLLTWGNTHFGSPSGQGCFREVPVAHSWRRCAGYPTHWYGALLGVSSTYRLVAAVFGHSCPVFPSIKSIALTACLFRYGFPVIFQPSVKPSIRLPQE